MLANDICRCLGKECPISRKQQCARYVEKDKGGPMTPVSEQLCGYEDEMGFSDYFIKWEE